MQHRFPSSKLFVKGPTSNSRSKMCLLVLVSELSRGQSGLFYFCLVAWLRHNTILWTLSLWCHKRTGSRAFLKSCLLGVIAATPECGMGKKKQNLKIVSYSLQCSCLTFLKLCILHQITEIKCVCTFRPFKANKIKREDFSSIHNLKEIIFTAVGGGKSFPVLLICWQCS